MFTRIESRDWKAPNPQSLKGADRINTQKHARLPCARRIEMKRRVTFERISFTQTAAEQGVAPANCCAKLGMGIERLLNDNGSALRSHDFARACQRSESSTGSHRLTFPLPAADERKGREVHPVGPARVGLRLDVPELIALNRSTGRLATP